MLAFPCNQFGNQEPLDKEALAHFCQVNYGVTFPVFAKIDVKGSQAHPLFKYLTEEAPGFLVDVIKWNFTKFLVDRTGKPVKRFAPTTTPESLDEDIKALL